MGSEITKPFRTQKSMVCDNLQSILPWKVSCNRSGGIHLPCRLAMHAEKTESHLAWRGRITQNLQLRGTGNPRVPNGNPRTAYESAGSTGRPTTVGSRRMVMAAQQRQAGIPQVNASSCGRISSGSRRIRGGEFNQSEAVRHAQPRRAGSRGGAASSNPAQCVVKVANPATIRSEADQMVWLRTSNRQAGTEESGWVGNGEAREIQNKVYGRYGGMPPRVQIGTANARRRTGTVNRRDMKFSSSA